MRVLIVKTSSMGDILHTLPAVTDAIKLIPDIRFNWVVEEDFCQIPTWHKGVDQVFPVAIRRWSKSWFSQSTKNEYRMFQKIIRSQRYDAVIDAQGLLKSAAIITRLTCGIKHGMNWKSIREPLASLFYNYRYHIKKKQHAVERNRELFAQSLGYLKPKTYGDYAIEKNTLCSTIPNNFPYAMFFHATTKDEKCWPETHWKRLIELMKLSGIHIKLTSFTQYEKQRAERLASDFSSYVEVLPKLSLIQIAKKLIGARVIVSVDTGLSHLATALSKPNIVLFGPTIPTLVGGYGKNQYQVVSSTKKMKDITADKVFMILQRILDNKV